MQPSSSPRQEVTETPCKMKDCIKNDFGEYVATDKRRDNCLHLQLVKALKDAQRILYNVRRANPDGFNNGVYDDPGDEHQEQAEAEVVLPDLEALLKAAGMKIS